MSRFGKHLRFGMASLALIATCGAAAPSDNPPRSVNELVDQIVAHPDFAHSWVGIEVYSLDRKRSLFTLNADKFFTPGSTTKAVTEGAALALLGPDYRFQTRIFRSGEVTRGVLRGDLVIVASGDPNLSGRVRPDGTLFLSNDDHSYGGPPLPEYPGAPIVLLARQIAAVGIKRITGKVLVDTSMFETVREPGSSVMVSPISVNDNVIDVLVRPMAAGQAGALKPLLDVPYVRFHNEVITGKPGDETSINYSQKVLGDGSVDVVLRGVIAADSQPVNFAYPIDDPARFASAVFTEQLVKAGVQVDDRRWSTDLPSTPRDDFRQVALYTSVPLKEDIRVTLKVSQNLHSMMMPYVIGSVLGHAKEHADRTGFRLIHDWLAQAGLDLSESAQWDGEGGAAWTPRFMTRYLAFLSTQPTFSIFYDALPIMGRDGTLVDMLPTSPAAGALRAKTGTNVQSDWLNAGKFVEGKALAGYTTTSSGERVSVAIFLNKVPVSPGPGGIPSAQARYVNVVGGAAAQLAAGVHLLPIRPVGDPAK